MQQPGISGIPAIECVLNVLESGSKNGTPKLGLLLAIYEFCMAANELGLVSDEALEVDPDELTDCYLGVYWAHAAPFTHGGVLKQVASGNREHFAVSRLAELRQLLEVARATGPWMREWSSAREALAVNFSDELDAARREMRANLWKNPVRRLQELGGTQRPVLYDWTAKPQTMTLLPGVTQLLVLFEPALRPITERRFAQIVETLNPTANDCHLEDTIYGHLFLEAERVMPSTSARRAMADLQGGSCLWTGRPVHERSPADHVVPWSRRQVSVIENFVLSTAEANSSKGALLLGPRLLEHWLTWLGTSYLDLKSIGERTGSASQIHRPISALSGLYRLSAPTAALWEGSSVVNAEPATTAACLKMLEEFQAERVDG